MCSVDLLWVTISYVYGCLQITVCPSLIIQRTAAQAVYVLFVACIHRVHWLVDLLRHRCTCCGGLPA